MSKNPEANIESVPFDKSAGVLDNTSSNLSNQELEAVKEVSQSSTDSDTANSEFGSRQITDSETESNGRLKVYSPFEKGSHIPSLTLLTDQTSSNDRRINEELNSALGKKGAGKKSELERSTKKVETASTVSAAYIANLPDIDINFFKDPSTSSWKDVAKSKPLGDVEQESTDKPSTSSSNYNSENVESNDSKSSSQVEIAAALEDSNVSDKVSTSPVRRDQSGKIESIEYPGKTRNFRWEGNQLVSYQEVGSNGTTEFVKDASTGKWAVDVGGIKVDLPGEVELDNKSGTFKIELKEEGRWRVELANGEISSQLETSEGAKVQFDKNNRLEKVTRVDGTTIEPVYEDGKVTSYIENGDSNNSITWKKDGTNWVADDKSQGVRKDFSVSDQAVTSFATEAGFEHTITGGGEEIIEGEGRAKVSLDDLGRVTKVEYANDPSGRVREVEYFGDSRNVKRFSVTLDGVTHHQTRLSENSNNWESSTSRYRDYVGEAKMLADGTFCLKRQEGDGTWDTRWTDNTTTNDKVDGDGNRTSYDDNGKLVRFQDRNGFVAKVEYAGNQSSKLSIKANGGAESTWTREADGSFTNPDREESRKNLVLESDGSIAYENSEGSIVKESIDGHTLVLNDNGSQSEFNKEGALESVEQKDGSRRSFIYDSEGELVSASDTRRNEKRTVFERSSEDQDVVLGRDGTIAYINRDGESVQSFADGKLLVKDQDGKLLRVKTGDGKSRQFVYSESGDNLEKIIDTRVSSKGEISKQVLTRESVDNGVVGHLFVGKSHKGKDIVREDVQVNDDGTYSYKDVGDGSDQKSRIAKIGGGDTSLAAWDATINKDVLDRVTDVVSGEKSRHYEYFGESNELQKLTIKKDGDVHVWERDSKDSDRWYKLNDDGSRPANAWRGQVQVTSNGIHMYRQADHYGRYSNSWNSTFPDGTQTKASLSENGSTLFRDDSNRLKGVLLKDGSSINVSSKDGKETITVFNQESEEATTWSKGDANKWRSDSSTATDTRTNLRFDERGALLFEDTKGRTSLKELDGRLFVNLKDGTKLGYDANGQLEHVQRRGKIRSFLRENGRIASVRERDAKGETRTLFESKGASEDRKNFQINDNGDFSFEAKTGEKTVLRSNGLTESRDANGNLLKISKENGVEREFKYSNDGQVTQIIDTRPRANGDPRVTTWTKDANNLWNSVSDRGQKRAPRKDVRVLEDGNFEYRMANDSQSDKPRIARLSGGDGNFMSETVEDGHYNLLEAMENHVERPRIVRMEKMMKQFESRMADQYELMTAAGIPPEQARQQLDDAMTKTYDHMSRLITTPDSQGQFHNQRQRIFLAENFMYHAADPTTIEQGNTGTCWWESSYAVGMERSTNHLARFVSDIALTGQYKSTAGKPDRYGNITEALHKMFSPRHGTVDLRNSRNGFEFANGWSIETADRDSTRSPVSRIIDNYGPAVLGWRSQGRPNSGGHGEAWRILYMMTGRKVVNHGSSRLGRNERIKLLREGGYTASGGGHMWGYCMRKVGDEWHVIRNDQYQNRDRVIARVRNLQEWIDHGTRDNVRKTWRPYSPTNPDQQPYKIDDIRDDRSPDRPTIRFRPLRFFRPFRFRRR